MSDFFQIGFLENIHILFVAILIYALIYAILKKIALFEDTKVNSVIAIVSAIVVSFSGVITYTISYAINWFVIIIFMIFLLLLILMFLGVKAEDIAGGVKNKGVFIMVIFFIIFGVIILKGFFAINNLYDVNNPQEDPYLINTSYNTGVDDITNGQLEINGEDIWSAILDFLSSELFAAFLFLLVLGIFVFILR